MCQLSARPFSSTPLYARAPHNKNQQLWFDMKVFYIRLSASILNNLPAPESLTVHCLPRNSNRMALEINGRRIHPSCNAFLTLERSRSDEKSSNEVAYVSNDSICVSGNLCFEVFLRDELLISGTLEKKDQAITKLEGMNEKIWSLQCSCKLEYTSKWPFQTLSVPSLDIFLAGRMLGFPLILTESVQMIPRKKRLRHGISLDVIPEENEAGNEDMTESCSGSDLEMDGCSCSDYPSDFFENSSDSNTGGHEIEFEFEFEEEEEDSWYNSGLGFGLSLGIGMLGLGYLANSKGTRKRIL